ncbi:MAG: hypothetical protein JWO58_1957 [Chitinophagaceae bacterium]|nr:hypothetical protein [Chitinophagaceae bacterium]
MNHEKLPICIKEVYKNIFFILCGSKTLGCFGLLLFCLMSGIKQASGAEPVVIDNESGEYYLKGEYLDLYLDSNGTKLAKDFKNNQFASEFKAVKGELSNRDYPKGVYWVRFTVEQRSVEQQWLIELPDPHIDQAELYRYDSGTVKFIGRLGHGLPFSSRNYHHKNLVFALPLRAKTEYLLRLKSPLICSFMISVKSVEKFTSYALWEYYMLGLYYGILLIMMLYNLFLYFNLREKNYLFYVFYVISCALYTFREDGIGFQYLWPQSPVLNQWLNHYFELFLLLSFAFYSISFLELRKKARTIFLILLADIIVFALLLVLEYFQKEVHTPKQYFYVFPFILLYAASFYLYRQGNHYIRYYLIAYSFLLISVFIFQARMLGFIEHTFFTVYIFNFGFIIEIVLMSFALGEKIYISTKEKEQAQQTAYEALKEKEQAQATLVVQLKEKEELKDRINRELEKKVQERTIELIDKNSELQEKNQKLALMSAKLEEMNSSLDKNNWELNKEVKQKTIASIAGDEITMEDFLKIFPHETACLLYLCELKWKDGYRCQKCNNTKYNKGDTPLSRKCSKCNHRESPTAGTLFHGIKTDLNKAFYITYLAVVNPKKNTLEELSGNLKISMNTCWKIRKKVSDKKKEMEAKHLPMNKWENYLL